MSASLSPERRRDVEEVARIGQVMRLTANVLKAQTKDEIQAALRAMREAGVAPRRELVKVALEKARRLGVAL